MEIIILSYKYGTIKQGEVVAEILGDNVNTKQRKVLAAAPDLVNVAEMVMAIQLEDGTVLEHPSVEREEKQQESLVLGRTKAQQQILARLVQQIWLLTPSEDYAPTVKAQLTASGPGPRERAYRYSYADRQAMKAKVEDLIQKRKGEISNSPFTSPVTLVRKGKEPELENLRLCVDYRKLNKVLQNFWWPMPLIDEIMQSFSGCEYFSELDFSEAFYHIELERAEDRQLCGFITQDGVHSPLALPMEIKVAPRIMQYLMYTILSTKRRCHRVLANI